MPSDFGRCFDPYPHDIVRHVHNGDLDVVADHDGFAF